MDGTLLAVLVGAIQGLLEWLPVSSEGSVAIVLTALAVPTRNATAFALVLHAGTAVAATVYYRDVLLDLLRTIPEWRPGHAFGPETADLSFYVLATLASGVTGVTGYVLLEEVATAFAGGAFVALIGCLLLGTGVLLWWAARQGDAAEPAATSAAATSPEAVPGGGTPAEVAPDGARPDRGPIRRRDRPTAVDAVVVGLLQGVAILPGVSRSGTTVSALLLRGHDGPEALRLSFVLSIPAALGAGAIALAETGLPDLSLGQAALALGVSAVVGYATVDALTRLARRLVFWRICLAFGALALLGGGLAAL